ncbi:lipopolysaccharide biosynthesis protein [Lactococcus garvieae]|uniref:lipopolysaccharide biosynthesis protein n=1 Tax=Lactococcus garvieae TaxID=1363 RepID=UPI0018D7351F|nr:oligosaccharide flippase family protein [Lactococcus garvieae]QPS70487.1 oligosaccharide flippase family protein [Lactococcus garvieae]
MRVVNSLRNSSFTIIQKIIGMILGFVTRTAFIYTLGISYQGLNGLFTSILSMLSIAELGIGSAIVFNMYRYIAENDTETMKSLMHFYRTAYRIVAVIVTVLGLLLLPFLNFFSSYQGINDNVFIIYLLFLANSVAGYLFSYKRSILYADQKNYIVNIFDTLYTLVVNIAYIIVLFVFKSFILYLISALVLSIVENILIQAFADKRYPWLKEKNIRKLEPEILHRFKKQIYGMFYHNIGTFVVMGSDSLVITKFLGLTTMGLYSNYSLITGNLSGLLMAALGGLTASIGNLLTEKDTKKSFEVYKNLSFATFWIFTAVSAALLLVMQPFIIVWLGEKFILSFPILVMIVLNFYILGMRKPIRLFQDASGIFYENRHIPVIGAVLNLGLSLLFVTFMGLTGVLLGTFLSTLILYGYSFPKYIYSPLFDRPISDYIIEQIKYLAVFGLILVLSSLSILLLTLFTNHWLVFFLSLIVALLLPNGLLLLIYHRKPEFQYFKSLMLRLIKHN